MKNQYVILTGAKNNAGDYLIKYRAKSLFKSLRPNRKVIDWDAWEPLTESQIEVVNQSRALILTGGPALQKFMYPGIYPLVKNLEKIKIPILTLSIGWKSKTGSWHDTYNYRLSETTLSLLHRINESGYLSSVRDYNTLNVLNISGFNNFVMTGCTGLYQLDFLNDEFTFSEPFKNISYSLSVSFFKNKKLERSNRKLIEEIINAFPSSKLTVVFHHSINQEIYSKTHNYNKELLRAQNQLIEWLEGNHISWIDISGSAEEMIKHYSNCDLHMGYRVHAHILMASLSKPSLLIAEDGRGTALEKVIGGIVLDGCFVEFPGLLGKILGKLGFIGYSIMSNETLSRDVVQNICYEIKTNGFRMRQTRHNINNHFNEMKRFMMQLP